MGATLIKRLKGIIDNDNMPIFGEQDFYNIVTASNLNTGAYAGRMVVKIIRGGYILQGSDTTHKSEVDTDDVISIYADENRDVYYKIDVYNSAVLAGVLNFDELKSSYSVKRIACFGGYKKEGGAFVTCTGSVDLIGDKFPNLVNVYLMYMGSLTGSIMGFAKCTKITSMNIANTNITGALEDFASSQIANGRVSGSVNIYCNGKVTYNGEAVPNATYKTITYNGNSYTIN